ncbi:hypothetical protein B566_EDAN013065 [Ephemera danica]|nr:hypothetical protein B566_EDAN013065 [Ephemera danica]
MKNWDSVHNLFLGVPKMLFVYSDLVETQHVGDVMARLLCVVRINIKNYVMCTVHTTVKYLLYLNTFHGVKGIGNEALNAGFGVHRDAIDRKHMNKS